MPLLALSAGCGTTEPVGAEELRSEWNAAFDTNLALQDDLIRLYRDCMEGKGFTEHPDLGMGTFNETVNPFEAMDRHLTVSMPSREYAEEHGDERVSNRVSRTFPCIER
ncbi:hypothetical protein [Stackebrandtia albiflava]|uniref:hypothetical protein n=1 Tax=Stackebrandtia albiflava TaxID=406432 RepID=UPI0011BD4939|nr:hypothetical protein [Stackebrandtia albiflava]